MQKPINKIVIVGGGTAGWMTAAALSVYLRYPGLTIQLIESEQIGTVGVGEATIPGIRDYNQKLGIDENAFMRATQATYKLGIEFINWSRQGSQYMHPFGFYGHDLNALPFYHYWLKQKKAGEDVDLSEYSVPTMAAKAGKFTAPVNDPNSVLSTYFYAFHLDAGLYAQFLRERAEMQGVKRHEGIVQEVHQDAEGGNIEAVSLDNGKRIDGDLFIDCSGFRALLIEKTLATGFDDWSAFLPADSAWAVPSERPAQIFPHTTATAHDSGWQWRIPLQSRLGNGMVFSSPFISDEAARELLMANLDTKPLDEARKLRFKAGMRRKAWVKNCVAIGLSAGFLEPLESTSIHLIQTGIMKLIKLFPDGQFHDSLTREYNRQMQEQFLQVRDFIILHYKATSRDDSEFWRYCQHMEIPSSLQEKLELFTETGHVQECANEVFVETNWIAVLLGQEQIPKVYNLRAENISSQQLHAVLQQIRQTMAAAVQQMPSHEAYIAQHCKAR